MFSVDFLYYSYVGLNAVPVKDRIFETVVKPQILIIGCGIQMYVQILCQPRVGAELSSLPLLEWESKGEFYTIHYSATDMHLLQTLPFYPIRRTVPLP